MAAVSRFTFFALAAGLLVPANVAGAADYSIVYSFKGRPDGGWPLAGLIADGKGDFFGTTLIGGGLGADCNSNGCGTIYEIRSDGSEKVIYALPSSPEGANPVAGLVADASGNLYGAAENGGAGNCIIGCGAIFKLTPRGKPTLLYAFANGPVTGYAPTGNVALDSRGDVYGTAELGGGGAGCEAAGGCGVVFKIAADGAETTLHAFTQEKKDGSVPNPGLIADGKGNFYGVTEAGGGTGCGGDGCGTIFEITAKDKFRNIHQFKGTDGASPKSALTMDQSGSLYGTTNSSENGNGEVFRLSPDGKLTVVYEFQGGADGRLPVGAVALDGSGNIYGTTVYGGTGDCGGAYCGTAFEIAADGAKTILHDFAGGTDGYQPNGALLYLNGSLYGTTQYGGSTKKQSWGTVFRITP